MNDIVLRAAGPTNANLATKATRGPRASRHAASVLFDAKVLLGAALLFAASHAAVGGEFALSDGKPADVGMRDDSLRAAVATMTGAVERGEIRGAVVLVARRGRIVLHEAVGWADFDAKRPMQRDTVFHVASNTKPVVAAVALQLVEQGKLDLDIDVGRYLPAFDKEAYRGVTLRRLLSHTSGLRIGPIFIEPLSAKSAESPDGPTLQSEVARFAAFAPEVKPGTSYSYNNPGFNIVGAVIEKVTGQPIDVVLERQIYKPLEMTSTGHVDRPGLVERRAVIETRKGDAWTKTYKPGDPPKYPFVRSSGGMLTTASDYAKFLQLFLNEGRHLGHELLKPRSVAAATIALTRSIYTDEQLKKQTSFYGLGWSVGVDGTFSHGGSDGTFAWADPRRELLGIVFTQSPGGKTPTNEFIAKVNEACEPGDDIKAGVVGHRGLLRESPENTLASFRDCLERRIGFELDVRRSRDGHLVCLHDDTLDRTTDGKGPVGDRTLEELRKLDAGGWFHASFRGERIPTLDEVFALAARYDAKRPVIAIDLKGDDAKIEADVVALANKHSILDRLVIIGRAIDHAEVRQRLKAADAKTPVACLAQTSETFAAALADSNSDWLYLRYAPSREEVATAHAKGKRLFLSGVQFATKQSENWRRAAVRGVDAILTDDALDLVRQLRDDQFRLQQTRAVIRPYTEAPPEFRGDFGKYSSPLKFADGSEVRTVDDWQRRRREIHADWTKLLGGEWPPLLAEPKVKIVATEKRENFTQHKIELEVLPGDRYAAGHLLIPDGTGPFPAALVTFYESNTSVGLGERGKGTHDYGLQLARRGFVTLSIGTPGSLEFPGPKTRELLTEAGEQLDRQPLSILAYVAASGHTALARHASVDPERIGVIGLSYGGKWSMFASLLDQRFACAVWSDPGIVFDETNGNVNYWEPWYLGYERGTRRPAGVPNAERPRTGLYKRLVEANRDMHELHSLMAPRPVLVSGGTEDPPRNWRALNHLVELNRRLGYEGRVAMTARKTHVPTPEALELELQFLELHLKYQ